MDQDVETKIIERLGEIHRAVKSLNSWPGWAEESGPESPKLFYRAPLKVDGDLGAVFFRIHTPKHDMLRGELYGHLEVIHPGISGHLRLEPIEWRMRSPHHNPPHAPNGHAYKMLLDRIHPFELNRGLGLGVFRQHDKGVACDLPRAIVSYRDYLKLCAERWRCPDIEELPPPPWEPRLV